MNKTRNDIDPAVREKMVALLNARLADSVDLATQLKQAHWNVKGANFIALHELFDEVASHARDWGDDLAERAVQLGGVAVGTVPQVAKNSALPTFDTDLIASADVVKAVADSLAAYAKNIRAAISEADAAGDDDTADLFTEVSRGADKDLWFVEAHDV